ncbi:MAG: NUDIX domain-containing protein [Rhabdochlamydiaceae bacterium]|nr:NUDIX domain-containing protein [Rhabdochlamydiaceae bacterium]
MERHFTATAYLIFEQKVLLLLHPKLKKWLPPGGHLEKDETPAEGAKREVLEETGLEIEWILQENVWIDRWNAKSIERPYLCLLENIPEHGQTPAHQHIDCIYLGKPSGGKLISSPEIRWFSLEEVLKMRPDEEIFVETQETISHLLKFSLQLSP